MSLKRLAVLGGLAAGAISASLGMGVANAEPMKVGFVYVSPIGDAGWTYQHDLGRLAIEKEFGDKIKTSYVESVPEGADAERVIREMAANGNKIIFTTSFGYMNPTIKVAKQFPKTHFAHATGYKRAGNVSTYLARFYEGRYLSVSLPARSPSQTSSAMWRLSRFPKSCVASMPSRGACVR